MTSKLPAIPLALASITDAEIDLVTTVLRSGWLAHGEYNHRFEEAFAEKIGVKHAISMNSCTSALEVALQARGIRGEVVIPSLTWVATANAVVVSGAVPKFCEVDPATRNVTAAGIAAELTPQTEAVMVVHFGGQPCSMDEIVALCERRGLFLIEDSAETLGATFNGRQAGSFGIGCFSFYPTKNITTCEGGMLTTDDDDFAARARALISHGLFSSAFSREQSKRPWFRSADMPGHNFRMPNPLAAMGMVQLSRLEEMNERRCRLADHYRSALADCSLRLPVLSDRATHVYQMFTVEVDETKRDDLLLFLRGEGIGASVHFDPPVHLQPAYTRLGWRAGDLPETEELCRRLVTLPIYPDMSFSDIDRVSSALARALRT
jgi:perosamine synthetase